MDWGSKYTGAVVRIAGLIHLGEHLRDGWGKPIDATTLDRAALIGEYYAAHALAAFDDMGADPTTRNAQTILAWIERTGTTAFTKRDLYRAVKSAQFANVADLDGPLAVLDAHGYVRQLDPPARSAKGGRPPSPSFLVHPDAHRPAGKVHALDAHRRAA